MNAPAPTTATPRQQQLIMWVLWFAFLNAIIMFRIFLVKPLPVGRLPSPDSFLWVFSLFPALLSGVIRWTILPRQQHVQQGLVCMILGLAFAEATSLIGIFLTPSHLNLLSCASFLAAFQFAPVWASRFFPADEPSSSKPQIPQPPR